MSGFSHDPQDRANSQAYRLIRDETVSLRVSMHALAAMDRAVRDGVRAFPSRGLEIGGLLSGSAEGDIRVDAILPLPMESRSSPAFCPSPSDLLFVKQSVAWAQVPGTGIIGHFRSQTSGQPAPTDADRVVADLINLPEPLLILIPASAAGVEQARIYRRVNDDWVFLLAFPLVESPPESDSAASGQSLAPRATHDIPPAELAPVPSRRRWRMWALGALAVGLAAGILLSHSFWKTYPAYVLPIRSDLRLQLHPEGSRLKVQWDPTSRPVADAISGMLTVQEGDHRLQIPLTRKELDAGSTYYFPESGWVEVRLEINQDGNHYTGETVATATGLPTAPAPVPEKPATPTLPLAVPPEEHKAIAKARPLPAPARTIARKAALPPPQTAPALPLAPQISPTPATPAILPPVAVPTKPPARSPEVAPFTPSQNSIRYETAVPIRKVRPAVPADLHSILPESISVEIKVEIDSAGKVVNATPVGGLTATQKLLAPQAVQAALLWRFEPARRNGEPVASESLLKFDFERDAR
jgi:Gram-negative bacterial TonB protein C-terminal